MARAKEEVTESNHLAENGVDSESNRNAGAGLPLFFQKPVALDSNRHAKSGLTTHLDLTFAKNTNSVALTALEFIEASKFYPIVFMSGDKVLPLAIVGLEQSNLFVNGEGQWTEGAYVPAYVRQYPFIFFEEPEQQKFILCVDEKAPQFRVDGGEGTAPFFNNDGTPSPMSNQALQFCDSYFQHHRITQAFTADLVKHNLLQPYQSQATLKDGRQVGLSGFSMIDETAFNALSDEVILDFRKKGWLPFIYLALSSASNWKRLSVLSEA